MLQWIFDRRWDRRSADYARNRKGRATPESTPFVLHTNKLYRAKVNLDGFEAMFADNGAIAAKFQALGFKDPKVVGDGKVRRGEAIWPGQDRTVQLPIDPHLSDVTEVA